MKSNRIDALSRSRWVRSSSENVQRILVAVHDLLRLSYPDLVAIMAERRLDNAMFKS
jgi:hypothetical protein